MFGTQVDADDGGHGVGVSEFWWEGFAAIEKHLTVGIANLVTVDAGLGDASFVVDFGLVFFSEGGVLVGIAEWGDVLTLFAFESRPIGGIVFVDFEGGEEGGTEGFDGDVAFGIFHVGTCAESAVDGFVGIHEEGGVGEVGIEFEKFEVNVVGVDDSDTDEFVHDSFDAFVAVGDFGIEACTGMAGNAAEGDEERFTGLFGQRDAFVKVVVDPVAIGEMDCAVVFDLGIAVVGGVGGECGCEKGCHI